jgi:hypothetical protein
MRATVEMALDINAEHTNFYPCMALPGSPLHRRAVREGTPLPDTYSGYGFLAYDCLPLPTQFETAATVLRERDRAWQEVTLDPGHLALVERKFGEEAAEFLRRQAEITLQRKLLEEK